MVTSNISAALYGSVVKRVLTATVIDQDMACLVLDIPIWGNPSHFNLRIALCSKMVPQITSSFKPQMSIHNCFVLWASSLRNEIYINFKLGMDRAFITMWEKGIKRLRFDSRATDGVRRTCWKKNAIVSQLKRKLKSRELQVISVRKMDISFKITVK